MVTTEHRDAGMRRAFALSLLCILLMQAAWSLVTPPFRGIDEHEHAFKAAAVARGDWSASHPVAPSGWGETVTVPTDLAKAAAPVCATLKYVHDNCVPRPTDDPRLSHVGTSAARYNPIFYAIIGTVARPFDGVAALYVMRGVASLLCALLLAYGFITTRRWSASGWLPTAFLLALTPVTIYSTAIPGPNGIELAGAILLWTALIGISRLDPGDARVDRLVTAAVVGAVPLCIVRTLGPVWFALTLGTFLILADRTRLTSLIHGKRFVRAAVTVLVLGALGPAWTLAARTNAIGSEQNGIGSVWEHLVGQWVLWFVQSVAAFPSRNERAPVALYAIAFAALWVLVALAWRQVVRRELLAMLLIVVATTAVAICVSAAAFSSGGYIWQGRYGYPYAVGFIIICGSALDRHASADASTLRSSWAVMTATVVTGAINLIGMLHVLDRQLVESPLAGTSEWPAPSPLVVVVLVAVAMSAYIAASTTRIRLGSSISPYPELAATQRSSVA